MKKNSRSTDSLLFSQKLGTNNTWKNIYTQEKAGLQIDVPGDTTLRCAHTALNGIQPIKCDSKSACGFCLFDGDDVWFQLKGMCLEGQSMFDTEYYAYGEENGKPKFWQVAICMPCPCHVPHRLSN